MRTFRIFLAGLGLFSATQLGLSLLQAAPERSAKTNAANPTASLLEKDPSPRDGPGEMHFERLGDAPPDLNRRDQAGTRKTAQPKAADHETATSLDEVTPAKAHAALLAAIDRATTERRFAIDSRIIEVLQVDERAPIIVGASDALPKLQNRLSGTRHTSLHHYRHIPYAALEVGPQALLELIETREISVIELDERHRPTLIESVPLIHGTEASDNGFDGSNYSIAILDTGVDSSHPIFQDRLTDEACFSRQSDCPGGGQREFGPGTGLPCGFGCGHGTLVAGIALGTDMEGSHHGVAPDAGLISIQVFSNNDGEPAAWTSDILAGLEHVYDLSLFHKIAAISLSLGGETFSNQSECDQLNASRKALIDQLRSIGIATVISSGNDGESEKLSSPACISSAISVGSTRKNDDVSSFSNSADFLSLLAPGHRIRTVTAEGGYEMASGTSMAAPHVSGAIAAIREATPTSTVDEILFALQFTGLPVIDARNDLTFPRIDVMAAIDFLTEQEPETEDETESDNESATLQSQGDSDSSSCGLIGLELTFPLALSFWLRISRRKESALQRT